LRWILNVSNLSLILPHLLLETAANYHRKPLVFKHPLSMVVNLDVALIIHPHPIHLGTLLIIMATGTEGTLEVILGIILLHPPRGGTKVVLAGD
jgi:hypothetical protein